MDESASWKKIAQQQENRKARLSTTLIHVITY